MPVADWIRATLWEHTDWRAALTPLFDQIDDLPARASDLAHACELIEPDRRHAFAMHRLAWRLGRAPDALTRAFELAREASDHDGLASLALEAFDATRDATHLVTAAMAYVDTARPAQAEAPLARALEARPDLDDAKSALAILRKQSRDPQADISSWVARATRAATPAEAARLYLHAARLARLAGLEPIFIRHVDTAYQRGRHPAAATLIEADLLTRRRADDLLAFYRGQIESAHGDRNWADAMRAAGTKLLLHNVQRGLAMRLLRSGLEGAYRARLADIPGHLATWDLLIRHARDSRSTRELMPLAVDALTLPLDDDARLFISRFGFDVTWREASDKSAAQPYAATIAELVPTDPDVQSFVATALPDVGPITYDLPPEPLPAEAPVVRMKQRKPTLPPAAISALRSGNRTPGLPTTPPLPAQAPRIAERIVVPADAEIRLGSTTISAVVRDLSATGIYLVTDHDLDIDSTVTIDLQLPTAAALTIARHTVTAKVVRRAFSGYGMLFIDPPNDLVAAITALTSHR